MPDLSQELFNRLMPESEGPTLCYEINKPITALGYEHNFLNPALAIIKKYGEVRLLLYFTSYFGWEEQAASMDISAYVEFGKYVKKMAFVNTPEKEVMARIVRKPLTTAEMRFFNADQLQDAIKWVKN